MAANHLTLSRIALYDMVWSRPMVEVAKDFNISDVALAKRCKAVDVPVPPRGWWARKTAGQNPPRTPLPQYRGGLGVPAPRAPTRDDAEPVIRWETKPPRPPEPESASWPAGEQSVRALIDSVSIDVPGDLSAATGFVKRSAAELKVSRLKDFTWSRGERAAALVEIGVSDDQKVRALRIADGLLRSAGALGWLFVEPPEEKSANRSFWTPPEPVRSRFGQLNVDGEAFRFRITEANRRSDHVLTDKEKLDRKLGRGWSIPKWDFAPSGVLTLQLISPAGSDFATYRESSRRPLETRLRDALHALQTRANDEKRWREEKRLSALREAEAQHLAYLARQRREARESLINELERQAGAWQRARMLRRYVRAAEKAVGECRPSADLQGQAVDFLRWAAAYVEQLDPLAPVPRNLDQQFIRNGYYHPADDELKKWLGRFAGTDGERPWKLAVQLAEGSPSEPDESDYEYDL